MEPHKLEVIDSGGNGVETVEFSPSGTTTTWLNAPFFPSFAKFVPTTKPFSHNGRVNASCVRSFAWSCCRQKVAGLSQPSCLRSHLCCTHRGRRTAQRYRDQLLFPDGQRQVDTAIDHASGVPDGSTECSDHGVCYFVLLYNVLARDMR